MHGPGERRLLHRLVELKAQLGLWIRVSRPIGGGGAEQLRPAQQQRGGESASAD